MTARTTLRLLYFAWLRERVGLGEEEVVMPDGVGSVAALITWLKARGPRYAAAFETTAALRCAVNQEFADADAPVRAGDEVAFFPPVTGG